jgi:cob(I)alamin adenosyltransferase
MKPLSDGPSRGRTIVLTGDGKGKTSAAMGMALRMVGHGWKVLVVQFGKEQEASGEVRALAAFDKQVTLRSFGGGWLHPEEEPLRADEVAQVNDWWARAVALIDEGDWDAVVLDELMFVAARGFLAVDAVTEFLDRRPAALSVVITGRGEAPEIIARADTVTVMEDVKHPHRDGQPAQPGIEY